LKLEEKTMQNRTTLAVKPVSSDRTATFLGVTAKVLTLLAALIAVASLASRKARADFDNTGICNYKSL
jgi:hypothetical protein